MGDCREVGRMKRGKVVQIENQETDSEQDEGEKSMEYRDIHQVMSKEGGEGK